jgi:hypothetical protein
VEQRQQTSQERAFELISLWRLLVPDWRPTGPQVLWTIRIAFVLGVLIFIGYATGVTVYEGAQLLFTASIPVAIAFVGTRYTQQSTQDATLQAYLKDMTELILDRHLRRAPELVEDGGEVRATARARTLAVLPMLDGRRKGSVVQFLYESGLIAREDLDKVHHVIPLVTADLSGLILRSKARVKLSLSGSDLVGTDLSNADLSGIALWNCNLTATNLSNANLMKAELFRADLSNAKLSGANLSDAVLHDADLSDADLADAINITNEELEQQAASLKKARMPDGTVHN